VLKHILQNNFKKLVIYKMSCCGYLGEYRQLCDYNGYGNCYTKPVNFACSPGIGCHETHDRVNHTQGVYSNLKTCKKMCVAPPKYSYDCEDLGCVLKHGTHGKFQTLENCQHHCKKH